MQSNSSNSFLCNGYVENLPCQSLFFTNFIIDDFILIDECDSNVKNILSIKSNITIDKTVLCKNPVEIKCLDGIIKGLLFRCELKMTFQFKYAGGNNGKNVYVKSTSFIKNVYVSVPYEFNDLSVYDLHRKNKFVSNVFVDDLKTNSICKNKIKFSVVGFVNVTFTN